MGTMDAAPTTTDRNPFLLKQKMGYIEPSGVVIPSNIQPVQPTNTNTTTTSTSGTGSGFLNWTSGISNLLGSGAELITAIKTPRDQIAQQPTIIVAPTAPPPPPQGNRNAIIIGIVVLAVVVVGIFAFKS